MVRIMLVEDTAIGGASQGEWFARGVDIEGG